MVETNWWKALMIGGSIAIISGFLGDIGSEFFLLVKALFTESTLKYPISVEQILRYIALGVGFATLGLGVYMMKKNSVQKTAEYRLNKLIKELQFFNKKWNKGIPLITSGYRNQILKKTIWDQNPEKIRNASVRIKRKNALLKELNIENASLILTSVTNISDNIAELGIQVENTFLTLRQEKDALEKNPKIFDEYVSKGDGICQEIQSIIVGLEKFRTNVYDLNSSKDTTL